MILPGVFERFAEKTPVPVMARAAIEYALSASALDRLFEEHADQQYTRALLFSSVFDLMSLVVTGSFKSLSAAYQGREEPIPVSLTSVYNKLQGLEPSVSAQLVRHTAARLLPVQRQVKGCRGPWLAGYRVRVLDGNHLAATQHRLEETRRQAAGPLPGLALVLYEPEADLVTDVVFEEDGHAQERSRLGDVVQRLRARDLLVADRNFCTRDFLLAIIARGGFFAIREHALLAWEPAGKVRRLGRTEGGRLREQRVLIRNDAGEAVYLRRVVVELDEPTRDGDALVAVLSNLPEEAADARRVASLYRRRWTVEHAFFDLAVALRSEINTLCYPRAALFGFAVGLVAYNLLGAVKGALRGMHGEQKVEALSAYYLADELAGVSRGMMVATTAEEWAVFGGMSPAEFAARMAEWATKVRLERFRKHPRGLKKPKVKRHYDPAHPHVSSARILQARNAK
jgi:hypothetical protein